MKSSLKIPVSVAALTLGMATPALAHEVGGAGAGFIGGFAHPFLGLDHVVAMVAVGLWGAFLRRPALYLLPLIFPLVMAVGGGLGIAGVPIPAVEAGIAASAIVLGLMVALTVKAPLAVAAVVVGAFAVFHGHAHGTELPASVHALAYSAGFVIATGLLHLAGIGLGTLIRWPAGLVAVRAAGGVIALVGVAFLTGLV
jgi:urease accessory protein